MDEQSRALAPERAESLVAAALAGQLPDASELTELLDARPGTEAARTIAAGAELLSRRASHGTAHVFCQIGIDARPCAGNCRYCSLAVCNAPDLPPAELSREAVVAAAQACAEAGANLVSLMSTNGYAVARMVELTAAVRDAVGPDLPIMVNTGDFGPDEARELREAGATTVYHALRLGEGVITDIDPETRLATIDAVRAAGIALATGVGPVHADTPRSELVDAVLRVLSWNPVLAGVCGLTPVPGTVLEQARPLGPDQRSLLNACFRLAAGDRVLFEYRNVTWVDCGCDPRAARAAADGPRARSASTGKHRSYEPSQQEGVDARAIARSVRAAKERLHAAGWRTEGPSMGLWKEWMDRG